VQRGKLSGVGDDAAGAAVDQDVLAGPQPRVLVQGPPGGERAERNGGGRDMVHGGRLGGQISGGDGDEVGGSPGRSNPISP